MSGWRRLGSWLKGKSPHLFLLLRTLRYLFFREALDPTSCAIVASLCGSEPRVLTGPFEGMKYLLFASGSGLLPKIVGSYELELHPAIEESLGLGYRTVINVGCAEGYYAVGYARALATAEVYAYDRDVVARQRLRELARLNGVEARVHAGGLCRPRDLRELVGEHTLIVCDCEGGERELLDPALVPGLARAAMLVEMHDFIDPEISRLLLQRFRPTHDIHIVPAQDRAGARAALLAGLAPEQRRLALWEGRPPGMEWAWMRPLTSPGSP